VKFRWVIPLVDTRKYRGKPPGWFANAGELVRLGVPLTVAKQWQKERWKMTVGLKRLVRDNRN